nr:hypothetical protein [Rhizobium cauense]
MSLDGRSSAVGATMHVNHWCSVAGCSVWGGFGHSSSKSEVTRWWCWEHYPYRASDARQEAVQIADVLGR